MSSGGEEMGDYWIEFIAVLLEMAFRLGVLYIVAAMGEVITQRSGIFNISIEGIMTLGAITSYAAVVSTGSHLIGFMAAVVTGALIGVLLGILMITLGMDQTLTGMLMWIFGIGMGALLYRVFFGVRAVPIMIDTMDKIKIPVLSSIPIIGPSFFDQNLFVYLAYLLIMPLTYFVLFKTTHGLKIRAVGENPRAADVLGINVGLTRYLTLIFAAIMQSVAGAYLLMAETAVFTPGMIGGRGWITLQLVMFGRWNPPLILGGAVLFSFIEALAYKVQLLYRMIPYQFLLMMPYIATIVTLVLISRGAVMPRMLGVPYKREKSE
jgi:ABC-type uncharacterized transport system permease subunit